MWPFGSILKFQLEPSISFIFVFSRNIKHIQLSIFFFQFLLHLSISHNQPTISCMFQFISSSNPFDFTHKTTKTAQSFIHWYFTAATSTFTEPGWLLSSIRKKIAFWRKPRFSFRETSLNLQSFEAPFAKNSVLFFWFCWDFVLIGQHGDR